MKPVQSPLMMRYLAGESIGRYPVWMMRQAGRYLPSYRAIREKYSFWEMASNPEVAAQVSLLPVHELPVDAVIFFSDILTLPYGLGLPITMKESVGPVTENPLRSSDSFHVFKEFDPSEHTRFVGQALQIIRKELTPEKALLGFAGAPWTVGAYLIEGKANRNFETLKSWMYSSPEQLTQCLDLLGEATLKYLEWQYQSGAQMVQLFDTWIGHMPKWFFKAHYLRVLERIFSGLKSKGIPAIYFTKHSTHLIELMGQLPVSGFSVDELQSLSELDEKFPKTTFLQGNLDPILLLKGTEAQVRLKTRALVQEASRLDRKVIMNLAHGILPGTPVENARAFLEEATTLWV
ncbi:MAG: uroporphyrinogen decarboxylase [Proteobacteria bacterium]|nr:uroporphyrinogen decarboxylase [Pseudomonadota bacterium]